jgi:hypothetical protein
MGYKVLHRPVELAPFLRSWPHFSMFIGPFLEQRAMEDEFQELPLVQEASQGLARFHNSDNDTVVLTIYDMHL